jgi:hypothetical protein
MVSPADAYKTEEIGMNLIKTINNSHFNAKKSDWYIKVLKMLLQHTGKIG